MLSKLFRFLINTIPLIFWALTIKRLETIYRLKMTSNRSLQNNDKIDGRLAVGWIDLSLKFGDSEHILFRLNGMNCLKINYWFLAHIRNKYITDLQDWKLILKLKIFSERFLLQGFLEFSTITALMGPSGSGKSTFLNCLFGKNSNNITSQTKLFESKFIPIKTRMIKQDVSQHLYPELTAKESILYAFILKNNVISLPDITNEDTVSSVIDDLLLRDCLNTRVSQLSGGQQKRLIIAMELSSKMKPNFILIDEPTSGLDSFTAVQVIY